MTFFVVNFRFEWDTTGNIYVEKVTNGIFGCEITTLEETILKTYMYKLWELIYFVVKRSHGRRHYWPQRCGNSENWHIWLWNFNTRGDTTGHKDVEIVRIGIFGFGISTQEETLLSTYVRKMWELAYLVVELQQGRRHYWQQWCGNTENWHIWLWNFNRGGDTS